MKFIRCAVHAADARNSGKNLQVGCVHGNAHALGVRLKHITPYPREPLTGLQARVDCQLCNLIKSLIEANANRRKTTLFFHVITVSENFVSRCPELLPICTTCSETPPHRSRKRRVLLRKQLLSSQFFRPGTLAPGSTQSRSSWGCPLLAQSGHHSDIAECPLSGVKRTSHWTEGDKLRQFLIRKRVALRRRRSS